ncbi:MAG: hypothetical protein AB8G86_12845, partial [Saprospiraceae bacterium]
QFCGFILSFYGVGKILIMLRHNSVFPALYKNKLKPHLLVGYLLPAPLVVILTRNPFSLFVFF